IIDVSDPTEPKEVVHYDTAGDAFGVYVKDNYAYVADSENGFVILDISDPENPTLEADMLWYTFYGVSVN
ncbi:hypothetical protein, partial [Petrotoga sp. Shatin.DS.tank11.9.2.9.3]